MSCLSRAFYPGPSCQILDMGTFPAAGGLPQFCGLLHICDALHLRRDHRKLGQQLDLYSINDSGGAGLVFWHPKVRRRCIVSSAALLPVSYLSLVGTSQTSH
jgi:hypothetical protein